MAAKTNFLWTRSLYLLMSWARWDWSLTCLINHCPLVLWRCWLDRVTHKLISKMTYNVSSGTLNPTIPYSELIVVTNPRSAIGILTLSITVPEIFSSVFLVWARPYCDLWLSKSFSNTFFKLAVVENLNFVMEKHIKHKKAVFNPKHNICAYE